MSVRTKCDLVRLLFGATVMQLNMHVLCGKAALARRGCFSAPWALDDREPGVPGAGSIDRRSPLWLTTSRSRATAPMARRVPTARRRLRPAKRSSDARRVVSQSPPQGVRGHARETMPRCRGQTRTWGLPSGRRPCVRCLLPTVWHLMDGGDSPGGPLDSVHCRRRQC